jgi:hypothetical protein
MMKMPPAISNRRRCSSSAVLNQAAPAPSATNIAVKPATNQAVVTVTLRGLAPRSFTPTPDTYER